MDVNDVNDVSAGHDRAARVTRIIGTCDAERFISGLSESSMRRMTQGCMVVTGPQVGRRNPERQIGFCVQIRRKRGQFGSDMVFLRHTDGSLVTHENQGFFLMTAEQEALARPLFVELPEEEDYSQGYSCCGKVREVGFVIENSASVPTPDASFAMAMTITSAKP